MKIALHLAAAALALSVTACGDAKVEAGELLDKAKTSADEALEGIDFSKLSPDAIKAKSSELIAQLTAKLKEIKDQASAEDVAAKFKPVVEQLSKAKTMLGEKMPSMESVKQTLSELETKFADNETVKKTLQPLLDKLESLLQ